MPTFLVHYELHQKPDVEYPTLIPKLTRLGARRLTATSWAVTTDMPIADLRDEVEICALTGDRFVIARIEDWRTINTMFRIESLLEPLSP